MTFKLPVDNYQVSDESRQENTETKIKKHYINTLNGENICQMKEKQSIWLHSE